MHHLLKDLLPAIQSITGEVYIF